MANTLYTALIVVHVAAGLTAITAGALALATVRRGLVHRRRGRMFVRAMMGIIVSGAAMLILKPNGFAASLTLIAAYATWSGVRAVKRGPREAEPVDRLMALVATSAALVVILIAWRSGDARRTAALSTAISVLCYTAYDLARFRYLATMHGAPSGAGPVHLYEHVIKIMGAFGGVLSAFSGTVFLAVPSPWRQLLPTLIVTPASIAVVATLVVRRRRRVARATPAAGPSVATPQKRWLRQAGVMLLLSAGASAAHAQSAPVTPARPVVLEDQYGTRDSLTFPTAQGTILVFADRNGAGDARQWGARLAARPEPLTLRVITVIELATVPRFARGLVRRSFSGRPSVWLDWDGALGDLYGFRAGCLAVGVDAQGVVVARAVGSATDSAVVRVLGTTRD